jgi:hypothetical protein
MEGMKIDAMRFSVRRGNIEWQRHALERMIERDILREDVIRVLVKGQLLEEYPEDTPFPSALLLGKAGNRHLHVVVAMNPTVGTVFVITVYEPDQSHFESDLRTRRKK